MGTANRRRESALGDRRLRTAHIVFVCCVAALGFVCSVHLQHRWQPAPGATMAGYRQLRAGMTYQQVDKVLNGLGITADEANSRLHYPSPGGGSLDIWFTDGLLQRSSEQGLREVPLLQVNKKAPFIDQVLSVFVAGIGVLAVILVPTLLALSVMNASCPRCGARFRIRFWDLNPYRPAGLHFDSSRRCSACGCCFMVGPLSGLAFMFGYGFGVTLMAWLMTRLVPFEIALALATAAGIPVGLLASRLFLQLDPA